MIDEKRKQLNREVQLTVIHHNQRRMCLRKTRSSLAAVTEITDRHDKFIQADGESLANRNQGFQGRNIDTALHLRNGILGPTNQLSKLPLLQPFKEPQLTNSNANILCKRHSRTLR